MSKTTTTLLYEEVPDTVKGEIVNSVIKTQKEKVNRPSWIHQRNIHAGHSWNKFGGVFMVDVLKNKEIERDTNLHETSKHNLYL